MLRPDPFTGVKRALHGWHVADTKRLLNLIHAATVKSGYLPRAYWPRASEIIAPARRRLQNLLETEHGS